MTTSNDGQAVRGGEPGTPGEIVPLNLALSYPVHWSRFKVLRDFVQNFFDAVGPSDFHRRVLWRRRRAHLELAAEGVEYSHGWLSATSSDSSSWLRLDGVTVRLLSAVHHALVTKRMFGEEFIRRKTAERRAARVAKLPASLPHSP